MSPLLRFQADTCRRALEAVPRIQAAANSNLRPYNTPVFEPIALSIRSSRRPLSSAIGERLQCRKRNNKELLASTHCRKLFDNVRRYGSQAEGREPNRELEEGDKPKEAPLQREGAQAPPLQRKKPESRMKMGKLMRFVFTLCILKLKRAPPTILIYVISSYRKAALYAVSASETDPSRHYA
jgi:hypothetical protein